VEGQEGNLEELSKAGLAVPDHGGKGVDYGEPAWITAAGNTWATPAGMKYIHDEWKQGNARENQALFDCHGKALPSLQVFH